jgi:hypothetical protein
MSTGFSGQKYFLFRSSYNDGDTWEINSPNTSCIVDTNKYCTFQTDHLSLFAFGLLDATITLPGYFSSSTILASVFTQTPSAYEVTGDIASPST